MKELDKYKILLIDERNANSLSLSSLLLRSGYQNDISRSVEEALELLSEKKYGLVILNLNIDGKGWVENLELIKVKSRTREIPVIFLSEYAFKKEVQPDGKEGEKFYCILKPVDEAFLLAKVQSYLQIHHSSVELERANKKLRREALRAKISYQDLYYSLPREIYVIDRDGTIVNINRSGLLFCGLNASDLLNHHYSKFPFLKEIISDRGHENLLAYSFEQHGFRRRLQLKSERIDKTVFYIDAEVGSVLIEGKFFIQVTIRDVTGKKIKEIELKKTVNELNNSYNELMQFNFIVSHNLRSPVANILGLAKLLNMPSTTPEAREKTVRLIETAALKMDDVVKDLSVILSARSPLNKKKEKVFIPDLVKSVTHTLEKQIAESGHRITLEFGKGAKEIFTIKSYLESIFYNLVSNSIKYKSGSRKPEIFISTEKTSDGLLIKVADNGIGIDLSNNQQHLYGMYKRFNLDVEGKGLGLHMTKIQVETLGGKISVESEIDKGTTFTLTFPA